MTSEIVEFKGDNLVTVYHNGTEYVALRPIVEAIGLNWYGQSEKFNCMDIQTVENKSSCVDIHTTENKFNCCHITTVAADGKNRKMLCIPIKKLNGWLFSINPNKVKPEIREKLIAYQEECFQVLHDYWNTGYAVNQRYGSRFSKAEHAYLRNLFGEKHYLAFFAEVKN